jgi:hypothetical protein
VTLYGKDGVRTIRDRRRTRGALQFLADGKEPDERIIAITDERIRQILTAASVAAGAGGHHSGYARSRVAEHDGPRLELGANGRIESVPEIPT